MESFAPEVTRLGVVFVNVFAVGEPGGQWVLVDTGLAGSAGLIRRAVAERFERHPEAIVLTHGHFDHVGSALDLAGGWGVPIYAHPLENPYLTGLSDYPPSDPTMGGAMAQLSRLMPDHGYDFGERVQTLRADGGVPGLADWRWMHTPGHTPGHVSLFREADGVLLAGDAFATMNLDSWASYLTHKRELSRPSPPFTFDWETTRQSVEMLADLEPHVVAAGHGLPIAGDHVAAELRGFATRLAPPRRGRYVAHPPRANERGVTELPPPVPDPLARRAGAAAALAAGITALVLALRRGARSR